MLNFRDYLDFAERYIRDAESARAPDLEVQWLLIPATILSWTAIESFVNNRLDELGATPTRFELHEQAFLLEQRIRFVDRGTQIGTFILDGAEYRRLEDKILFLLAKSGGTNGPDIRGQILWQQFEQFKNTRNSLVHPRIETHVSLSVEEVQAYVTVAKDVIRLVSSHVWHMEVEF